MITKLHSIWLAVVLSLAAVCATATAWAAAPERRVALVIGNGAYRFAPALENPTIDARGVAAALRRIGFEVIDGYDLSFIEMRAKLSEFAGTIADTKAALVYYAGHGVSVEDENFLLPVDIALKSVTDLDINAINIDLILRQMRREERVNVVILDACRDNPFAKELAASTKNRSTISERGLSRIDVSAKGTLIAFATDPKSVAADGPKGSHSPFTMALLKHIETPGASIDTILNRVRAEVWETTNKRQMPWVNTSLIGEFILNPAQPAATLTLGGPTAATTPVAATSVAATSDRVSQEQRLWDSAEKSNAADDYQAYLDAYPTGTFAQMAKNRIGRARLALAPAATDTAQPTIVQREAGATPETVAAAAALKAEVSTPVTEKALGLKLAQRKELQQRLIVMGYDKLKVTGTFDEATRAAIGEWQKSRNLAPTTWLGKAQHAALIAQSEQAFQRFVNAQPLVPAVSRTPKTPAPVAPGVRQARQERIQQERLQQERMRRARVQEERIQVERIPRERVQRVRADENARIRRMEAEDMQRAKPSPAAEVGTFLGGVGVGILLNGVRR
ncbi:MAG: caspase family protein [Alsobacter sp.]